MRQGPHHVAKKSTMATLPSLVWAISSSQCAFEVTTITLPPMVARRDVYVCNCVLAVFC